MLLCYYFILLFYLFFQSVFGVTLIEDKVFAVLEYCLQGSLLNYLRSEESKSNKTNKHELNKTNKGE